MMAESAMLWNHGVSDLPCATPVQAAVGNLRGRAAHGRQHLLRFRHCCRGTCMRLAPHGVSPDNPIGCKRSEQRDEAHAVLPATGGSSTSCRLPTPPSRSLPKPEHTCTHSFRWGRARALQRHGPPMRSRSVLRVGWARSHAWSSHGATNSPARSRWRLLTLPHLPRWCTTG